MKIKDLSTVNKAQKENDVPLEDRLKEQMKKMKQ